MTGKNDTPLSSFVKQFTCSAVNLTAKEAADLLDINLEDNRKKKEDRSQKYLHQMQDNEFIPTTFYVCVLPSGVRFLVDGQHRIKGFLTYSGENHGKNISLPAIIVELHVGSEDEVGEIYTFFDRRDQTRTAREMNAASKLAEKTGVDPTYHEQGIAAISVFESGIVGGGKINSFENSRDSIKRAKLSQYRDFFSFIHENIMCNAKGNEIITVMKKVFMNSKPLSVILYLWDQDEEACRSFLMSLFDNNIIAYNNGTRAGNPLYFLYKLLNKKESQGMSFKVWVYLMSIAWNQYTNTPTKTKCKSGITRQAAEKHCDSDTFNIGNLKFHGTTASRGLKHT